MADITMCSGIGCPQKEKCYRFTALSNEYWQSYFTEPPIDKNDNKKCEEFWDNKEYEKEKSDLR